MTRALDVLLEALHMHGWRAVLILPRNKRPLTRDGHHASTCDLNDVRDHVRRGGNVGIYAGTHVVLDVDRPDLLAAMALTLGSLPAPTVETGSGKRHFYVRHIDGLRGKVDWGEIRRTGTEYVVAPPSVHPCGQPYRWLVDPRVPLPELPATWASYLTTEPTEPREPWTGAGADDLWARAMAQPHAGSRGDKVIFQCPGCRSAGHDHRGEHAVVFADGRFTCVVNTGHRAAIARVLEAIPEPLTFAALEQEYLRG